jgi:hypothetical protein
MTSLHTMTAELFRLYRKTLMLLSVAGTTHTKKFEVLMLMMAVSLMASRQVSGKILSVRLC